MENLYPATIGNITRIEYGGQLVLTTAQLAEFYDCNPRNISENFKNNEDRFIKGKHFFKLDGDDLNIFRTENFGLQISPQTRTLYLWTKRGCARHCKSIGTDKAWEVFELLEDTYFAQVVGCDKPLAPIDNFQRGRELVKLAQSANEPTLKNMLIAKAANLILGEEFLPIPENKPQIRLTLKE